MERLWPNKLTNMAGQIPVHMACNRAYKNAENTEYCLNAETDLEYSSDDIQNLAVQVYQDTSIRPTLTTTGCDQKIILSQLRLGNRGVGLRRKQSMMPYAPRLRIWTFQILF